MSQIDKDEFNALYEYVRTDIFKFDKNQSLPSSIVLGLKGLKSGKAVENKNVKSTANYSFKVILYTFKKCKPRIEYAIRTKDFDSEIKAFRYITKIVEGELNSVYKEFKNAEKTSEKASIVNVSPLDTTDASYVTKSKRNKNKTIEGLW